MLSPWFVCSFVLSVIGISSWLIIDLQLDGVSYLLSKLCVYIVKLLDEGKLNLDDPVQKYVPNFPEKQINSKPCVITIRQLLCHRSGIRHYHKTNKGEGSAQSDKTKSKYDKR